jgi:hypothetical protein
VYSLQEELKEITGMDEVTLQPAAGAHGEWTALMKGCDSANPGMRATFSLILGLYFIVHDPSG